MSILPSVYRESVNFFEQSFLPTLTAQQKKISIIALLALGCLAACYAVYCVRNWKASASEEEIIEELQVPKDIPQISEDAKVNYKKGMHVFSLYLLQKVISDSSNSNQLISPLGISLILSMIKHGVGPKEQAEIDRIIHLPQDLNEMKVGAFELIQKLKKMGFDLASLVYLNPEFRLNPGYQKLVSQYYQSKVEEGDSAKKVNQWVEKNTNGQIKEIITEDDLADFVVILANALHFKAKWAQPFEALSTYKEDFFIPISEEDLFMSVKKVKTQMMHQTEEVRYFEDDNCQAIALGYSDVKDVSLLLILPKKDNDFSFVDMPFCANLYKGGFSSKMVKMAVPKFKLEQEVDVKAILEGMGIKEIFDKPDFSQLIDFEHHKPKNAYFDKIKQKSVLAFDEEGTEASSATVAVMKEESCKMPSKPDKEIKFNRPFLAALLSKEAPVLFGVIRDPSAF